MLYCMESGNNARDNKEKNMIKYEMYIGANNNSGMVEYNKIADVLNKVLEGYTIIETRGVWQGVTENSCIVTVFGRIEDDIHYQNIARELCTTLEQDAILYVNAGVGTLITS